jgi:hypothetical protein
MAQGVRGATRRGWNVLAEAARLAELRLGRSAVGFLCYRSAQIDDGNRIANGYARIRITAEVKHFTLPCFGLEDELCLQLIGVPRRSLDDHLSAPPHPQRADRRRIRRSLRDRG